MKLGIQPFIFSGSGEFDNAVKIYDQLQGMFPKVIVLNSDKEHTRDGWITIRDGSGFGAIFQRAVGLFNGDIMLCVQADARCQDYPKLIEDARAFVGRYDAGVYAPNVDPTWWIGARADIPSALIEHPNLKLVAATGETVMFIRSEVLDGLAERNIKIPPDLPRGGIDSLLSSIAYAKGLPVIRDYGHTVTRSEATGEEIPTVPDVIGRLVIQRDDGLQRVLDLIRGDRQGLVRYLTKDPEVPRVLGTRVDYLFGSLEFKRIPRFFDLHRYSTFVETGTFTGDGVRWALSQGFEHIYSIEIAQGLHDAAVARFAGQRKVRLRLGDSKVVLPEILKKIEGPAFFFLDAHCSGRYQGIDTGGAPEGLPLQAECLTLMDYRDIDHSIIVIDDERLMIDPPEPSSNFGSAIKTWLLDTWCGKRGFHATYLDDALIFQKPPG